MKLSRLLFVLLTLTIMGSCLKPSSAAADGWEYVASTVVFGGARLLSDDFQLIAQYEGSQVRFGDLASFTGYRLTLPDDLDEPRDFRYALDDLSTNGFRLGLRFQGQLDLVWSRSWGDTRYRVWMDGEEQHNDPDAPLRILLPTVDVRMDLLSVAWQLKSLQWRGIAPVLRTGLGWILLSQNGDFQAPYRPAFDNSDSEFTVEFAGELQWRWKVLQASAELSAFMFRWESEDDQVPASQVWSWMWKLNAGVAF